MIAKTVAFLMALTLSLATVPISPSAYAATTGLSQDEQTDLIFVRELEKVARDAYITFYDQWDIAIFSNIAKSEQKHMDAVFTLLKKYGIPDPAAGNGIGVFTNPALQSLYYELIASGQVSALQAFEVGGLIEETDIHDITAAVARSQHADITRVYENLLCGSRNHLRSFAKLVSDYSGQPYVAQVLTQQQVDQILASPMEKCGSNGAKA